MGERDWRRRAENLLKVCAASDVNGRIGAAREEDFVRLVMLAGAESARDELEAKFYDKVADLITRSTVQNLRRDTDARGRNRLIGRARKGATLAGINARRSRVPAKRILRKLKLDTATEADVQPFGRHLANLIIAKSADQFAEGREARLYGDLPRPESRVPVERNARGPRATQSAGLLANPRARIIHHFAVPLYLHVIAADGRELDPAVCLLAAKRALAITRAYFGKKFLRSARPPDILLALNVSAK